MKWSLVQGRLLWRVGSQTQAFHVPLTQAISHRYSLGMHSCDTQCRAMGCPPLCQLMESVFGFFFAKSINSSHSLGPSQPSDNICKEPLTITCIGMLNSWGHFHLQFSSSVHSPPAFWMGRWVGYQGKDMRQFWCLAVTTVAMQDEGSKLGKVRAARVQVHLGRVV